MQTTPLHILFLSALAVAPGRAVPVSDGATTPSDTAAASDTARPEREAVLAAQEVLGRPASPKAGVRVIGRDELSRAGSLVELLGREPGLVARQAGGLGSYSTLSLRGSPTDQVEVWIDGVPAGGSTGSTVDLGPVAVDGIERVEIRQAGAPGSEGAPRIDLVSRRGWAGVGASARVGSFGEKALSGWWGDSSGRVSTSAWYETADNDYPFPWDAGTTYKTSDDRVVSMRNNDFTGRGAALAVRPTATTDVDLRLEDHERGVSHPNLADPDARLSGWSIQGRSRWRSEAWWHPSVELALRRFQSEWNDPERTAGYDVDRHSEEEGMDGQARAGVAREEGDWFDAALRLAVRGESSERTSLGRMEIPVTPSGSRRSGSIDASWTGTAADGFWGAELAGRLEKAWDERDWTQELGTVRVVEPVETSFDGSRLGGRIWVRPLPAVSTWVSGTRRTRPPDFTEWMGDNGYSLSVPDLDPETSWSWELGGAWDQGPWRASIAGWTSVYRDPIEAYQLGASPIVSHRNGSGYEALGADGRAGWFGRFASVSASGTLQTGSVRSANPQIDGNVPRRFPRWKSDVQLGAGPWFGARAGVDLYAQGPTWASELNWPGDARDGRVRAGSWLRWSRRGASISLIARNLFDDHAEDFEDLPLSGRSFQARLDLDLPTTTKHQHGEDNP